MGLKPDFCLIITEDNNGKKRLSFWPQQTRGCLLSFMIMRMSNLRWLFLRCRSQCVVVSPTLIVATPYVLYWLDGAIINSSQILPTFEAGTGPTGQKFSGHFLDKIVIAAQKLGGRKTPWTKMHKYAFPLGLTWPYFYHFPLMRSVSHQWGVWSKDSEAAVWCSSGHGPPG